MNLLHLLEPEETVGRLWHTLVGSGASTPRFPDAAVHYDDIASQLRVFYRGVGGDGGIEFKSAVREISHHRLNGMLRLGARSERFARARFDGIRLLLPDVIDDFPDRQFNKDLYFWLVAWMAAGGDEAPEICADPLTSDFARIQHAATTTRAVLQSYPGLRKTYSKLSSLAQLQRRHRRPPPVEARVEAAIQTVLSQPDQASNTVALLHQDLSERAASAGRGYRTYLPVPLWGEIEATQLREHRDDGGDEGSSGKNAGGDGKVRRAKRRSTDQINRKRGFYVHRFEKILTWTEFLNLHRNVDDDDEDSAKKAADDHEEIGVGRMDKKAATRLKIDLDLSPADVDIERLSDVHTYPEWDYRKKAYLLDHTRVLERSGELSPESGGWQPAPDGERRIRAVHRQFEALRPKREVLSRQLDGADLDLDAVVRSMADMTARGEGSDHIYLQAREQARDLSVAVLVDVSRSTEGYVENRAVIDIEREALVALAEGLKASGDEAAIFAFSSLRRDRVYISKVKDFDDTDMAAIRSRVAALRPGFYTRLGAAIRHTSQILAKRPSRKRLLIVLTDGKPNDLDHYEGRFGIEDTRKAIEEARRAGQCVFGITIDDKAQNYFPRIFGPAAFAIVSHPNRLIAALPVLYRHLVS